MNRLHLVLERCVTAVVALIFILPAFSLAAETTVYRRNEPYLLQLREIRPGDKGKPADRTADGPISIEVRMVPGESFYVRESAGGFQTSLSGKFDLTEKQDGFKVELLLRRADLRDDPVPTLVIKQELLVEGGQPKLTDVEKEGKKMTFELSVAYFMFPTGVLYPIADWKVQLVDEAGVPVQGAKGSLVDEEWNWRTETLSDANGILGFTDEREYLPLMTFAAEHKERGLFATANFDRAQAKDHIFTLILRKQRILPAGFEAHFR